MLAVLQSVAQATPFRSHPSGAGVRDGSSLRCEFDGYLTALWQVLQSPDATVALLSSNTDGIIHPRKVELSGGVRVVPVEAGDGATHTSVVLVTPTQVRVTGDLRHFDCPCPGEGGCKVCDKLYLHGIPCHNVQ